MIIFDYWTYMTHFRPKCPIFGFFDLNKSLSTKRTHFWCFQSKRPNLGFFDLNDPFLDFLPKRPIIDQNDPFLVFSTYVTHFRLNWPFIESFDLNDPLSTKMTHFLIFRPKWPIFGITPIVSTPIESGGEAN